LGDPIWIGDLRAEQKNWFLNMSSVRLKFAILIFCEKLLSTHRAFGNIISLVLSHWQKLFFACWVMGKNCFSHAECALKIDIDSKFSKFFAMAECSLKIILTSWVFAKNCFPRAECSLKKEFYFYIGSGGSINMIIVSWKKCTTRLFLSLQISDHSLYELQCIWTIFLLADRKC
jgi:hypothetical protein